jgi:putative redox protein
MAIKKVTAELEGDGLRLVARASSGHLVVMDDARGDSGPRPAELLVVAQAGCSAMDVVSILRKKRQPFTRYRVRVIGQQRDDPAPHVFEQMRIVHVVDGPVDPGALRRAIELSATKYCTVSANLAAGVTCVRHAFILRDGNGDEHYEEVVVTGPGATPPGLGSLASVGPDPVRVPVRG